MHYDLVNYLLAC